MSAIASTFRRFWVEIAWGLFAAANVAVIFLVGRWETIPFHLVWVSLALVYGSRLWSPRTTVIVLVAVSLATGAALLWAVTHIAEGPGLDELAEVPLMAAMFAAMAWHARHAETATEGQRRLLELQRDFVRDASHELRTPITVATGHAELIRTSAPDDRIAEDAGVIIDELERLSRLSERLLILAAAEHPDFLTIEPVAVRALLEDVIKRWRPTASRRWEANIAADGWLPADVERLQLALDALVENAVKFTADGDRIAIGCRSEGDILTIEVSDSGTGIGPDKQARVFDRFARADSDRGRGRGGTGLGLPIVKAVVEAHGGSVGLQSRRDRGTSFTIRLPKYRARPVTQGVIRIPDASDPIRSQ